MNDALVLGGGPAGSAAAIALARAGARVTVIEREAGPREKVCGEFLGPDAARLLDGLGLSLPALGALPIGRARLAAGGRDAGWALPFAAWSLPRAVLDEALLARAAALGARVLRGRTVVAAAQGGGAWRARLSDGGAETGRAVLLATGKHALRGHPRRAPDPRAAAATVGLKLPLRPASPPASPPMAEVVLLPFPGGYAGLQPRPGGGANLCAALRDAGPETRDPAALIARVAAGSALGARLLRGAVPLLDRPIAVAGIPYGFRHRDGPGAEPGLYRVGDQFAVIPSLAGDGIAMALAGGEAAARAILDGRSAPAFHAALGRRLGGPMRWAGWIARGLDAAPGALVLGARVLPLAARAAAGRTRVPG